MREQAKRKKAQFCQLQFKCILTGRTTLPSKKPPASSLIMKTLGIDKGSGVPNKDKVGSLSHDQLAQIAKTKMDDLNANDLDAAIRIIAGTARSMGVDVESSEKEG